MTPQLGGFKFLLYALKGMNRGDEKDVESDVEYRICWGVGFGREEGCCLC